MSQEGEKMKELLVITKSKKLAIDIYEITKSLPNSENYGLKSQMQRSAVSIVSNLAEGKERGDKEFIRFIKIARGNLAELKIQLDIACEVYFENLTFYDTVKFQSMTYDCIEEIGKMTYGLMLKLKSGGS